MTDYYFIFSLLAIISCFFLSLFSHAMSNMYQYFINHYCFLNVEAFLVIISFSSTLCNDTTKVRGVPS